MAAADLRLVCLRNSLAVRKEYPRPYIRLGSKMVTTDFLSCSTMRWLAALMAISFYNIAQLGGRPIFGGSTVGYFRLIPAFSGVAIPRIVLADNRPASKPLPGSHR